MSTPGENYSYEDMRDTRERVLAISSDVLQAYGYMFETNTDVKTTNHDLLFMISGGVIYEDVLAGDEAAPEYPRQASLQRCIRTDGLDKIGVSGRHHVSFDMLGHFSFYEADGAEARHLAILPAIEILQQLGIENVFARCHPDDVESRYLLESTGMEVLVDTANVHVCNQRRRSGYRVELGRYVDGAPTEMWNIVFTLYEGIDQSRVPLEAVAFDSGASVDRLVAAVDGAATNFEADAWVQSKQSLQELPDTVANRIADLTRAVCTLQESGVQPGAKKDAYVARKLYTELIRCEMEYPGADLAQVVRDVVSAHGFSSVAIDAIDMLELERARIANLIARGSRHVTTYLARHGDVIDETGYAYLKDTFGLDSTIVDTIRQSTAN
ncbi:TPA: hypothetical protein DIV49_02360 [Candidatus Saccharibacteria bacterium]|nr:hypothetical protein [Candidatus Saccharibacteria bacterium]HRJ90987.1 alanine--tRNA ligase-related protein [Candidatus Saccharibacteria bacterium]